MHWFTAIVLIVDREDEILGVLRTALQPMDYVLLHARTGDEALAVLSRMKSRIDLTIIDLELPNDDGLVISLLTLFGRQPITKIIVKTSRQDKPFLEQVNHLDIDAIVLKPISEDQLIKTVQETMRERKKSSTGASAGSAA